MKTNRFFAVLLAIALPTVVLAGDEPVSQTAYTGTQGCTAALSPNTRYAVQCTTDCYIRVTADTTNAPATSTTSVKLGQDKLYDVYTTRTKRYICGIRVSSDGTMKTFRYQDGGNE